MNKLLILLCLIVASCQRPPSKKAVQSSLNDQGANYNQMKITAVQAKIAVIELLKLEGTLNGLGGAIERMENAEVTILDSNRIKFDAVTCDLKKNEFVLNIIAPPIVSTYYGEIKFDGVKWKAEITGVTRN